MSNEARIQGSLQITATNFQYQSKPSSFYANVTVPVTGPTPGYLSASQSGTLVSLSALGTPGLTWIMNIDPANNLEIGVYIPSINAFIPMLEALPGEEYTVRLSQFLGQEMGTATPGTGDIGTGVELMVRGVGGACECRVDVFGV